MNDQEERELIRSIEQGEWEPAADAQQLKQEFIQAARNTRKPSPAAGEPSESPH